MKNQFKDEQTVSFSISTFKKVLRFVRILGNKTYFSISKVDLPQVIWKLFPIKKKKIDKIQYTGRMGLKFLFIHFDRFLHLCCSCNCIFNRSLCSFWFFLSLFEEYIWHCFPVSLSYSYPIPPPPPGTTRMSPPRSRVPAPYWVVAARERMRGWTSDQGEVYSTNGFTCCHARPDGWDKSQLL